MARERGDAAERLGGKVKGLLALHHETSALRGLEEIMIQEVSSAGGKL